MDWTGSSSKNLLLKIPAGLEDREAAVHSVEEVQVVQVPIAAADQAGPVAAERVGHAVPTPADREGHIIGAGVDQAQAQAAIPVS